MWYRPDSFPISLIDKKYTLIELFKWTKLDANQDNHKQTIVESLREYLYQELRWSWIQNARFKLDYENNMIEIFGENKEYSRIHISPSNRTVILKYDGNTYENLFRMDPKKRYTVILGKGETIKEIFDPSLLFDCQQELLALLFSIQYNFTMDGKIKQILANDVKFRKALERMTKILEIKDYI
jgi:hypothetical protein